MEDSTQSEKVIKKETALAQRVARIFGYDGLNIVVKDGAGWQSILEKGNVTLVVDPLMLKPKEIHDATGAPLPENVAVPEQYSVYAMAHELGHIDDYMRSKADIEAQKKLELNRSFFWNVVDDAVINRRLRNIPLLNTVTNEIYENYLFPDADYETKPKHLQFMYGWLLQNVTPQRSITFDPEIHKHLDELKDVNLNGKHYDIGRILAHPDTSIEDRRSIATEHLLPIYESLLEQDKQEKKDNGKDSEQDSSSNSQDDPSSSDWDDAYDSYSDAAHQHVDTDDKDENKDDAKDTQDEKSSSIDDALKEVAEALNEAKQDAESDLRQAGNSTSPNDKNGSDTAGNIAKELEISENDAQAYLNVLQTYQTEIHQVGNIFQILTVPSIEYNSPRYARRSDTTGLRLSERDLFQVAIAAHSSQDPAIWKPVESIAKKEGLSFNGLDIELVIDGSASMDGEKAEAAAACAVVLMEGLSTARRSVQRNSPRSPKPDVRLRVIMFGASSSIVVPMGTESDPVDKGRAFATTRRANSGSTIVSGALRTTLENADTYPNRTQIVFIISDGDFSDDAQARTLLKKRRSNYYVYQHILKSPTTRSITENVSHINDPAQLPAILRSDLQKVSAKFLT